METAMESKRKTALTSRSLRASEASLPLLAESLEAIQNTHRDRELVLRYAPESRQQIIRRNPQRPSWRTIQIGRSAQRGREGKTIVKKPQGCRWNTRIDRRVKGPISAAHQRVKIQRGVLIFRATYRRAAHELMFHDEGPANVIGVRNNAGCSVISADIRRDPI